MFLLFIVAGCKKDDSMPDVSPTSSFTYTIDPANYKKVIFQNSSHFINSKTKYIWTFGDGDSSSLENPSHIYANDGTYSVVLKVMNGNLIDCSNKQVQISSYFIDSTAIPPIVSFVYSQKGQNVYFTNNSSGLAKDATFTWNFGDGSTSSSENPNHAYTSTGFYNVVLKVTTNYKSYSFSRSVFITESEIAEYDTLRPIPDFVFYYKNSIVYFINTSSFTNSATKYLWNFGDGKTTETSENPSHVYENQGTYNVVLKVSNSKYTITCVKQVDFPYKNKDYNFDKKPIAKFVYSQNGKSILFQNVSSNITSSTTYYWTFGAIEGGNIAYSTQENPFYVYTNSGTYNVVLKVTNDDISDSYSLEITIP